jgi:S-DNA-T family DNA segregation ATPase FtsK/SpoIIIE
MLFLWPGTSTLLRGQGTYLSDDEINRVIGAVATTEPQFVKELVQLKAAPGEAQKSAFADRDELYEAAIDLVVREGRGSVSLLQRGLGIGYGRAARLIDFMAEDGFVGPYNGSQAREILLSLEQWEEMTGQRAGGTASASPAAPAPRRSNKIMLGADEEGQAAGADGDELPASPVLAGRGRPPLTTALLEEEDEAADEDDEEPPFDAAGNEDEDYFDRAEMDREGDEADEADDGQRPLTGSEGNVGAAGRPIARGCA